MFAVIYSFTVKENKDSEFVKGWKGLTELIYEFEGSLGSRLHKESEGKYIAYAQWPAKSIWEKSGSKLPESAYGYRKMMKESCSHIQTIYELEMVEDFVQKEVY